LIKKEALESTTGCNVLNSPEIRLQFVYNKRWTQIWFTSQQGKNINYYLL